jgi:hypothetical protein
MKKVMFLTAMVALLVFTVATSAFASTAYFDYTVGGKEKAEQSGYSIKPDLNNYLIGVEVPLDQFKVVAEYGKSTAKYSDIDSSSEDNKVTTLLVKGGYRLLQNDAFQLYGDLSYSNLKGDGSKYSPIMIGVDGKYALNEKMFVSGNLDYAVSGKYKVDGSEDTKTDYMVFKAKYTYQLTENLGAVVGYNYSNMKIKYDDAAKSTDTGFTLGVAYNF